MRRRPPTRPPPPTRHRQPPIYQRRTRRLPRDGRKYTGHRRYLRGRPPDDIPRTAHPSMSFSCLHEIRGCPLGKYAKPKALPPAQLVVEHRTFSGPLTAHNPYAIRSEAGDDGEQVAPTLRGETPVVGIRVGVMVG